MAIAAVDAGTGMTNDMIVGADVDQKCRMEYLLVQNTAMIRHSIFADTKAGALLGACGVLGLQGPAFADMGIAAGFMTFMFLTLVGLALIACIWSIYPRFPGKAAREEMASKETWSWPALGSSMTASDYADQIEGQSLSHLYRSLAHSNSRMAQIMVRKYQMQRFAFGCAVAAFLLWAIPMALSLNILGAPA